MKIALTLAMVALPFMTCNAASAQEDVADVPQQELRAGGDANKRYFLIGLKERDELKVPRPLLVVLPGGNGTADFNPFVKRIYKKTLQPDYLVAQLVAVQWKPEQQIVWPTKADAVEGAKFTTEEFVAAVVADVKTRAVVNEDKVFTLAWSSSGPAAYAISLLKDSPVRGSFIAMSVFKPTQMGSLTAAKGRFYFLLHSPEDQTCPYHMAQDAERKLAAAGATVKLVDYPGGHGWRGDIWGNMKRGFVWLDGNPVAASAATRGATK